MRRVARGLGLAGFEAELVSPLTLS